MFIYLCGIYMERNNLERFSSRIFLHGGKEACGNLY